MRAEEGVPQGPISAEDRAYLERRAEAHLELAALSTDVRVVRAHYTLTNLYLDRLYALPPAAEQRPLFHHWRSC